MTNDRSVDSVMQRLLATAGWDAGSGRHKQLEDALDGAGLKIVDRRRNYEDRALSATPQDEIERLRDLLGRWLNIGMHGGYGRGTPTALSRHPIVSETLELLKEPPVGVVARAMNKRYVSPQQFDTLLHKLAQMQLEGHGPEACVSGACAAAGIKPPEPFGPIEIIVENLEARIEKLESDIRMLKDYERKDNRRR